MTSAMLMAGQASAGEAELEALAQALDAHEGCTEYTRPEQFNLDTGFWGDVVNHKPYTLIGDTNHRKPHLLAYMGNAEIIDRWAQNGVTDVYLEVQHEDVWPQLEPYMSVDTFDEAVVEQIFSDYIEERGLHNVGEWGERRAEYFAAFFGHALRNNIHFHLISQDITYSDYFQVTPQQEARLEELDEKYRLYTRANSAECGRKGSITDEFFRALGNENHKEFQDHTRLLILGRILSDRDRAQTIKDTNHGGRVVVIFGSGHFTIKFRGDGDFNMRDHLGVDDTFYVSAQMYDGYGIRNRIESNDIDALYFMRCEKGEYIDDNTAREPDSSCKPQLRAFRPL